MTENLIDRPAATSVQCIVWGRVVDYLPLLRRYEAAHASDGQNKLDEEFVHFYEMAKKRVGISPSGFQHSHGSGFAIVKSPEEVDQLAQALLEIIAADNAQITDERDHKKLAIGAAEWHAEGASPGANQIKAYKDVSDLAEHAAPFEIRLSGTVYNSLCEQQRNLYEPVDNGRHGSRGGAKSWRRVVFAAQTALRCVMRIDMARSNGIRQKLNIAMKSETAGREVQNQISEIISLGFNEVEAGSYDRCYRVEFGGDGGLFLMSSPMHAHQVAHEILKQADLFSEQARNANIELGMRCFRIGIDIGELALDNAGEWDGGVLGNVKRLECGGATGEIRISETAYRLLPEDIRKKYGDKELIRGKGTDLQGIFGRRFDATRPAPWPEIDENGKPYPRVKRPNTDFETQTGKKAEPCFVICPFSDPDGRSAKVFNTLIRPACEQIGMSAERADHFPGDRKQLIKEKLKSSSIVIAFLGNADEGLNSNLILEVGYRLATGKPLVLMCDTKRNGETPDYQSILPIQLNSDNIITLGGEPKEKISALCAEITAVKGRKHTEEWDTPYPMVMYRFSNPNTDVIIEESNSAARNLFGEEAVRVGGGFEKLREVFAERLEQAQVEARRAEFMNMFPTLIAYSLMQNSGSHVGKEIPMSRIPLVFKNSPVDPRSRKPRGYLAVITRWSYEAGICRIRYMYLPVSDAMRMDPELGYYVCDL